MKPLKVPRTQTHTSAKHIPVWWRPSNAWQWERCVVRLYHDSYALCKAWPWTIVHAATRHSTGNMIRVPASVAFSTYGMNPVFFQINRLNDDLITMPINRCTQPGKRGESLLRNYALIFLSIILMCKCTSFYNTILASYTTKTVSCRYCII